ncbi:ROK family protein [Aquisediminimonas profunda]|uniref:ROK family protein n=1 Tax=Aquisediminimonas profunda TaxID=1550733 RepID=UPI001C6315CB|nr:ROK family protein [Aquisediminimonas profunda]
MTLPWSQRIAGIELGGTKAIAALARQGQILEQIALPTTSPDETIGSLLDILSRWNAESELVAIGVATFGPVRLDPDAHDFGRILDTPKIGWRGTDILGRVKSRFSCPVGLDTDVNAAGLAEAMLGAGRNCRTIIYVTLGTGVGGGIIVDGSPVRGKLHPEIGHLRLRRASGDAFAGICPFHGDCIEGLISGPALAKRFGSEPATVPPDHKSWNFVVSDLAELLATLLLTVSPHRILIGGGVGTGQPHLLPKVVDRTAELISPYLPDLDTDCLAAMITLPKLGSQAGPVGALLLAGVTLSVKGERWQI